MEPVQILVDLRSVAGTGEPALVAHHQLVRHGGRVHGRMRQWCFGDSDGRRQRGRRDRRVGRRGGWSGGASC